MATKKATTKKATKARAAKAKPAEKMSQLNAAVEVLRRARKPMSCKEMVEAMQAKGLWTSPGGKTPEATLCMHRSFARSPNAARRPGS